MQTIYHRFADDYRRRYARTWGHDAPKSCDDYAIVALHEAAKRNKRNYSDEMRADEVLLNMLYWVNPVKPEYPNRAAWVAANKAAYEAAHP